MRTAMYDEARLYFENIVRENKSVVSLVDSDYTFLNGTLAELKQWDARLVDFGRLRVQVLGVLPDGPESLRELVHDDDLSVTLLSDESGEMERAYAPRVPQGEGSPTAVIDREGEVVSLVPRSRSTSHPDEVVAAVHRLRLEHPGGMDPMKFGT